MRDANYLVGKAKDRGAAIGRFTERLLTRVSPFHAARR
jgi:hypothetical protein